MLLKAASEFDILDLLSIGIFFYMPRIANHWQEKVTELKNICIHLQQDLQNPNLTDAPNNLKCNLFDPSFWRLHVTR